MEVLIRMASKPPVRLKSPAEMNDWINRRQANIEKMLGRKITKMEAQRIIARTDGIDLPDYIIKDLKKGKRK